MESETIEQTEQMQIDQTPAQASTSGLSAGGDVTTKFKTAQEEKDAGDTAFKGDDRVAALRHYHQALLYLKGLDKQATQQALGMPVHQRPPIEAVDQAAEEKQKTEVDFLAEKIYANMCQCHVKNGNWKRVIETADMALKYNPKNSKVTFRKARALKEMGYFEKAAKILEELIKDGDPGDKTACEQELESVRQKDKEVTKKHNNKMKGFLNKEKVNLSKD